MAENSEILIYQAPDGMVKIDVRLDKETVWLTQKMMAQLFQVTPQNITMHLTNIYGEEELSEEATCKNSLQVQIEGKREVSREQKIYNLDAIISVGYRIKSQIATQFRIWATNRLKDYLIQGYALNQQRFEQNASELEHALKLIKKTAQSPDLNLDAGRGLVEIISRYTQTFLWLQRYDEGLLDTPKGQTGGVLPSPETATATLMELKQQLMARNEATDLFAQPRADGLASILGNLNQSVFGEPAYPTIESKAATSSTSW
ncbi:MAG: RhuM family protein [Desulfobulbaceae bacterium]|jgi:hypothetical protein|nr:RhuM family protein [Desulfobulbaceae bacterium]